MQNKRKQIKRVHTTWCHVCEVTGEEKNVIVIEIRAEFVSTVWGRKINTGAWGSFMGDRNILYLSCDICYKAVCNHQNSENGTFTACAFYVYKLDL